MTQNEFFQLISIICRIAAMAFVATRFVHMKYGFWYALVRFLFYNDSKPIEWLKDNLLYCYLLVFECSQFYLIMGLLHQFAVSQVETKPWEFFFASPLTSISTILILRECFKKEHKSRKKAFQN
jgi:hypothetical protein